MQEILISLAVFYVKVALIPAAIVAGVLGLVLLFYTWFFLFLLVTGQRERWKEFKKRRFVKRSGFVHK